MPGLHMSTTANKDHYFHFKVNEADAQRKGNDLLEITKLSYSAGLQTHASMTRKLSSFQPRAATTAT